MHRFRELLARLWAPRRGVALVVWVLVLAAALGLRFYLIRLLPVYVWSKDATSYLEPAVRWLETGQWETDVRRGPVYSLFLAGVLRVAPDLSAVMWVQHALGVVAVLAGVWLWWCWFGRRGWLPLLFCGVCYAIYLFPIYLEHLIRDETLLFFFSALAFAALGAAFAKGRWGWFAAAGLAAGLVHLTKSMFHPFVPVALVLVVVRNWKDRRAMLAQGAALVIGFALPLAASVLHYRLGTEDAEPASYAGIQFYGRVAQWTALESPPHHEVKERIRPMVEEYRQRAKLDNNWVIKDSIVPVIFAQLAAQGRGFREVNKLCQDLAFEAIRTHPREFARQVGGDLVKLHLLAYDERQPQPAGLEEMAVELEGKSDPPAVLRRAQVVAAYRRAADRRYFRDFYELAHRSVLFETAPPVLLTTLLLPVLAIMAPAAHRPFFITAGAIWFFNVVLLSTVGKPMNRYFMPLTPVMFCALSAPLFYGWEKLRSWAGVPGPGLDGPVQRGG
jgi:hypothetical protein